MVKRIWQWLSKSANQRTLGFLGAGIAAVAVGLWQAYVHLAGSGGPGTQSITSSIIEAAGDATVVGRDLINGITLAQHDAVLKQREAEIQAQLEREALRGAENPRLNAELASVSEERAHVEAELKDVKLGLGELAKRIEAVQGDRSLAKGLLDDVDDHLRKIEAESSERAAEAAFQQGLLAEKGADLVEAIEHYQRAMRFAPQNPAYQRAAKRLAEQREPGAQGLPPVADLDDSIHWQMQSAWTTKLFHGEMGLRFTEELARRSDRKLHVQFREPGALVPWQQILDAVGAKTIHAAFTTSPYQGERDTSFYIFGAIPFGPDALTHYRWMKEGSGQALLDDLYAPYGVKSIPCGMMGPEGAGWFKRQIHTPENLQGLRMRIVGLGQRVLEKLGVRTQFLPAVDLYPALERGIVEAAEFSTPHMDIEFGFYQLAKYYYYPGWHASFNLMEFIVNKQLWQSLSPQAQMLITEVCEDNVLYWLQEDQKRAEQALSRMRQLGVRVQEVPSPIESAARRVWNQVVAEEKAKNGRFAKIYEDYTNFISEN